MQRLLSTYVWDAGLVQGDLAGYVLEHMADAEAVLVVDETGFLKKGNKSAGVQRQYSGTAGRIENCQIGVFLAYASSKGRTLLDRELYLPQVWAEDWERRREAGVPEEVSFRTKPQLAQLMLERALESGVPFGWVAGDEVYGSGRNLRLWLEREGLSHVLAIKRNEKLWALTEKGPCQVRADRLASQVEETGWVRCSAGNGAKGPRALRLGCCGYTALTGTGQRLLAAGPAQSGRPWGSGLLRLLRPGWDDPGGTGKGGREPVGYRGMLRGGQGTGGAGPVRGKEMGWLVPAHHLGDAGSGVSGGDQASGDGTGRKGGYFGLDEELIPLTVPEVRRLLTRLVWTENQPPDFILYWSWWRRRHQARAQHCHYKRRLSNLRL